MSVSGIRWRGTTHALARHKRCVIRSSFYLAESNSASIRRTIAIGENAISLPPPLVVTVIGPASPGVGFSLRTGAVVSSACMRSAAMTWLSTRRRRGSSAAQTDPTASAVESPQLTPTPRGTMPSLLRVAGQDLIAYGRSGACRGRDSAWYRPPRNAVSAPQTSLTSDQRRQRRWR